MSYFYKSEEVKRVIGDNWFSVLAHLAPELNPALERPGRHVYCPVHGGKNGDAFRLFRKDAHTTGGAICNTCGPKSDGIELLMWLKGWNFNTTLKEVGDYIGAPKHFKRGSKDEPFETAQTKSEKPQSRQLRGKGRVLDFGPAPYRFDKSNGLSYFLNLSNKKGKKNYVWGVDLERVIEKNDVQKGDYVSVFSLGRQAVTLTEPVVDADGEVLEESTKQVHRNVFDVVCERKSQADSGVQKSQQNTLSEDTFESSNQNIVKPKSNNNTVNQRWAQQATDKLVQDVNKRAGASEYAARKIATLWEECLPLTSHAAVAAHSYFLERGFAAALDMVATQDEIRFHPELDYFEENNKGHFECIGKFPAIIAAIRDLQGNLLTLHRTYLTAKGKKANVRAVKKMMRTPDDVTLSGSAIQIDEPFDGVLGITEGIETALSVYRATGISTWSTINAELLKSFIPPENVHTLVVWADLDRSNTGERAAMVLKTRLKKEGVKVLIAMPQCAIPKNAKSVDWNDVLVQKGRFGFPNPVQLRKHLGLESNHKGAALSHAFI